MTQEHKEQAFKTIGEVVAYLRKNSDLQVVEDSDLPKPTNYTTRFDGTMDSDRCTVAADPVGHGCIEVLIQRWNAPAYVPVDDPRTSFRARKGWPASQETEGPPLNTYPVVNVPRRLNAGNPVELVDAHPISEEEYVFLTLDWDPQSGYYQKRRELHEDGEFVPNEFGYGRYEQVRIAPMPFKLGDDNYFESRLQMNVYDTARVSFGQFSDPIQQSVCHRIAEKFGIAMQKPPVYTGGGLRATAMVGGTTAPRMFQNSVLYLPEWRVQKDHRAFVDLTPDGIARACNAMKSYREALDMKEIIKLRGRHAKITKELKGLPDKALEYLV